MTGRRRSWGARATAAAAVAALFSVGVFAVVRAEQNEGTTAPGAAAQGRIAGGGLHSCAVLTSGVVQCWGSNDQGQLGNGTVTTSTTPVATGITTATAIAAGNNHTCALLTGGTVTCWGLDGNGQLGDGTTGASGTQLRLSPVSVGGGLTGVTAIAAGGFHTCGLLSNGTVRCWGDDGAGQIGDGVPGDRSLLPVAVPGITTANPATAIAAGEFHTCALL